MIQLGDIDQLEALLLNPHQEFEPYRILSPLVSKFSTDEIRKIVVSRPGIKSSSVKREHCSTNASQSEASASKAPNRT